MRLRSRDTSCFSPPYSDTTARDFRDYLDTDTNEWHDDVERYVRRVHPEQASSFLITRRTFVLDVISSWPQMTEMAFKQGYWAVLEEFDGQYRKSGFLQWDSYTAQNLSDSDRWSTYSDDEYWERFETEHGRKRDLQFAHPAKIIESTALCDALHYMSAEYATAKAKVVMFVQGL